SNRNDWRILTKPTALGSHADGVVLKPLSDASLCFATCVILRADNTSRLVEEYVGNSGRLHNNQLTFSTLLLSLLRKLWLHQSNSLCEKYLMFPQRASSRLPPPSPVYVESSRSRRPECRHCHAPWRRVMR